jgi:hypothetical protein
MRYGIKVGAVTNAQRALKLLRSKGYKPILSRIENPLPNEGCGYVINVESENNKAINILKSNGISILGVEEL